MCLYDIITYMSLVIRMYNFIKYAQPYNMKPPQIDVNVLYLMKNKFKKFY